MCAASAESECECARWLQKTGLVHRDSELIKDTKRAVEKADILLGKAFVLLSLRGLEGVLDLGDGTLC